jgi:dienelactone hydrolase
LYEGQTAENLDSGLTLMDAIGWEHGIAPIPASVRPGLPVQVHVAGADPFAPEPAVGRWHADAAAAGLAAEVFIYPGAGHFYTDSELADYHATAARRTWQRITTFLSAA